MRKISNLTFDQQENVTLYLAYDSSVNNAIASLSKITTKVGDIANPYFPIWGIIILKYIDLFDGDARKNVENVLIEEFKLRIGDKIKNINDIINYYKEIENKKILKTIEKPKVEVLEL